MSYRRGFAATLALALVAITGSATLSEETDPGHASAAPLPAIGGDSASTKLSARPVDRANVVASRRTYREAGPERAITAARTHFADVLTGPGEGAPRLPEGTKVVSYLNDRTARTRRGNKRGLLVSTLPLRSRDRAGRKRAIDIALERRGGSFAPRQPLVPTRLGAKLARGLAIENVVTAVPASAAGRSGAAARRLGSDRLFYPAIARDTDFIAESTLLGFESFWQLRSPESPTRHVLRNRLARGVELRQAGEAVQILKRGRRIGQILPPKASDAAGRPVAVEQVLRGRELELFVDHRRADVTYPVLVDPGYIIEDWWHPGTPTWHHGNPDGLAAWTSYSNNSGITTLWECWVPAGNCSDGNVLGLFIQAQPGYYYDRSGAFHQFVAQGQGDSTYIDTLQGAFMVASSRGGSPTADVRAQILDSSGAIVSQSLSNLINTSGNPAVTAARGTVGRFTLQMSGSANRPTWNTLSVGGAYVHMTENSAPSLSGSANPNWNQSAWHKGTDVLTLSPTFVNTGFGVKDMRASFPTRAGTSATVSFTAPCDGHYLTRCSYTQAGNLVIPTTEMPEGVNTINLFAYSPSGSGSINYPQTYRLDNSPPSSITIGGGLAGKENGTVPAGTYTFSASATDSGCTAKGTRSGIKTITVLVDGNPMEPDYGPSSDPACSGQTGDIAVTLDPGAHTVEVTATDGGGLPLVKAFSVTATPSLAPENVGKPIVVGEAEEGQQLVAQDGTWIGSPPLTASYKWQTCAQVSLDCVTVPGATGSTFAPSVAEVGTRVRVIVTQTNSEGAASEPSEPTAVVASSLAEANSHPLDQPDDELETYATPTTDTCVPDVVTYPGSGFCGDDSGSATYSAEIASNTATEITHRGFGISDDYRTPDSFDATPNTQTADPADVRGGMFGGPYLNYNSCFENPDNPDDPANGSFLPTAAAVRRPQDPRFRDLGRADAQYMRKVRIIAPFDVMEGKRCAPAVGETAQHFRAYRDAYYRVAEWILAAYHNGKQVMVSFEKSVDAARTAQGPPCIEDTAACRTSSTGSYLEAMRAFFGEFEGEVTDYTAWNEPNNGTQPTSSAQYGALHPSDKYGGARLAARYYRLLRSMCSAIGQNACFVAAGDFLDTGWGRTQSPDQHMVGYLKAYLSVAEKGVNPSIWAIHAYSSGFNRDPQAIYNFAAWTGKYPFSGGPPRIWLTEQGGVVFQRKSDGTTIGSRPFDDPAAYQASKNRAKADADFLLGAGVLRNDDPAFVIDGWALKRRFTRFYYYDWNYGGATHDSSLIEPRTAPGEPPNPQQGETRGVYTSFDSAIEAAPAP